MLVVYLSSLLQAAIVLHALVNNKTTIGKVVDELEPEEGEKEKMKKEKKKEKEKLETKDLEESNTDGKKPS